MALPFNLPPELLNLAQAGLTWAQKNGVNAPSPQPNSAQTSVALQTQGPMVQTRTATYAGQYAAGLPVTQRAPRGRDPTVFTPAETGNLNPVQPTPWAGVTSQDLLVAAGIGLFFWRYWPQIRQG